MYKKVKIHFCQFHASPYPSSTFEIKSLDQKKIIRTRNYVCARFFLFGIFTKMSLCMMPFFVSIAQRNWGSCKMYFFSETEF